MEGILLFFIGVISSLILTNYIGDIKKNYQELTFKKWRNLKNNEINKFLKVENDNYLIIKIKYFNEYMVIKSKNHILNVIEIIIIKFYNEYYNNFMKAQNNVLINDDKNNHLNIIIEVKFTSERNMNEVFGKTLLSIRQKGEISYEEINKIKSLVSKELVELEERYHIDHYNEIILTFI